MTAPNIRRYLSLRPRLRAIFRLQWEAGQHAYVLLHPEGRVTLNPSAGEILSR
ncbi:pyrroloquinoline quinone biosynthesis peptide chaperone PqqD, partial [Burkholderia sp. SIMBA_051]